MKFNEWNFSFPESVLETLRALDEIKLPASTVALYDAWNASVPSFELPGIVAAMKEYAAIADQLSDMMSATKLYLGLEDFIDSAQLASLSNAAASVLPLIDTTAFDAIKNAVAITDAFRNSEWTWAAKAYSEAIEQKEGSDNNVVDNTISEMITPEIRSEIATDITQTLSNPTQMQTIAKSKYLQWKDKHPGFAALFLEILFPFLLMLIPLGVTLLQARPARNANVYEEPKSTSNVVYNVTVENNLIVVGDVPYFYEIILTDPVTGNEITGYIYKGNVVPDKPDTTPVQEEDTIADEDVLSTVTVSNECVNIAK